MKIITAEIIKNIVPSNTTSDILFIKQTIKRIPTMQKHIAPIIYNKGWLLL